MVSRIHGDEYQQEIPMASRIWWEEYQQIKNLPRRYTARNTRHQESAKKNYSKYYQASRIRREEIQQELPGVKNLPRRTTARNTRRQESAKKNYSKKYSKNYQASRIRREELQQEITNGIKNLSRRHKRRKKVSRHLPRRYPAHEGEYCLKCNLLFSTGHRRENSLLDWKFWNSP